MAAQIEQSPLYGLAPVGQDIIFTVSDSSVVSNFTNVKFIAEVHISSGLPPNPNTSTDLVGTFKTTPNNAGVGMFDFRPIIESFVNADNLAARGSSYKSGLNAVTRNIPLHLIDKFSRNSNIVRYLFVRFKIEYDNNYGRIITKDIEDSDLYTIFNGYVKHTNLINIGATGDFGYNTQRFYLNGVAVIGDLPGRLLTNAPLIQYANDTDYGTISFISTEVGYNNKIDIMTVKYYDSSGAAIGTADKIPNNVTTGGYTNFTSETKNQLMHFGCYPGNLRNWSTNFASVLALGTLSYYIVCAVNSLGQEITETLRVNLLCPNLKGFEPIRLTWLNQWGVWDYYTFTMKSLKKILTKGSTYQQLEGTWNEKIYQPNGFKGGKKSFRVNATDNITMNTDFVSEAESEWFEELINSPEVYILEGYKTDKSFSSLNTYVIPVRLTTSSYTTKTIANDKLMQYTFEVEKSKTLRTQAV